MRYAQVAGFCLSALVQWSPAAAVPLELDSMQELQIRDKACTNGPLTRACWNNGYSIATDFDQKFPVTGNTVTYDLYLTNTTCNPDGASPGRQCLLFNGQFPGPVIRATWGDTLVINVHNQLTTNGTSIHWHGVRQYHSPGMDGVNGLTECPLAPGKSKTYTFQVTQFGTSWYHAHHSSQYGDGVVGTMIFDGPATANYDIDLGTYALQDWYYATVWQVQRQTLANLQAQSGPPASDTILINGTMTSSAGGAYNKVKMTAGKKYRLRIVNIGVDNFLRFSLDSHPMQIIATDFIPVKPFYMNNILIGVGQRYDVIINANQTAGSYWFRVQAAAECLSAGKVAGQSIFYYDSVAPTTPSSTGYTLNTTCTEPSPVAPYWYQPVPSGSFVSTVDSMDVGFTRAQAIPNGDVLVLWALNTSSMDIQWGKPTLSYLMEGDTNYTSRMNIYPTMNEGGWNYWVVQMVAGLPPIAHPMHLHGHDFFLLGFGSGQFNAATAVLNWNSPPRRDTATLPGGGWLAIAFNSNNPGAWLFHCHIAWHVSEGLAVQFLESPSSITYPEAGPYNQVCSDWNAYEPTAVWQQDDSGL